MDYEKKVSGVDIAGTDWAEGGSSMDHLLIEEA